jgi:hypothetical protein
MLSKVENYCNGYDEDDGKEVRAKKLDDDISVKSGEKCKAYVSEQLLHIVYL